MTEEAVDRKKLFAWVGNAGDLIRFVQLLVMIGIAVVVFIRDWQDRRPCSTENFVANLVAIVGPHFPPELTANFEKFAKRCLADPDEKYVAEEMVKVLSLRPFAATGVGSARADQPSKQAPDFGRGLDAIIKPPAAVAEAGSPKGWVAVGYVGGDASFEWPEDRTITTLGANDRITAKVPVNLRKNAADWTNPLGVVAAHRTVKVSGPTKTLTAGSLRQVWAPVELD